MTNQHPIKPSQEQLQRWMFDLHFSVPHPDHGQMNAQPHWMELVERVAQWGADQELQACINFVYDNELCDPDFYNNLRTARRPEPLSLKEQALEELENMVKAAKDFGFGGTDPTAIRRALEQLND